MLKPESLFNGAAKAGTRATDVVPKLKKTAVSGGGAGMGGMYGDVKTHVVMELGGYGGRDGVASTATAGFKLSASSQRTSAANSSDDAAALREQNERLLDECRRLKAVNTNLYQMALDGILSSSPASAATTPSVGK